MCDTLLNMFVKMRRTFVKWGRKFLYHLKLKIDFGVSTQIFKNISYELVLFSPPTKAIFFSCHESQASLLHLQYWMLNR